MTVHTRDALAKLPAYTPGKTIPGAIKLASNEMSAPPLPAVVDAITEAVSRGAAGINRYPDNGAVSLTDALVEHVGHGASAENIAVGCGSVAVCQQLIQATCDDDDEVLFAWRSFEAYPIVAQVVGARAVTVPLDSSHRIDLSALAEVVNHKTRVIFVCTPNNPTGTVIHSEEFEAFATRIPDDVLIVLDEAYTEFVTDDDVPDGIPQALTRPNVVSLRTLSKAYGLAGLRVGYVIGHPDVITAVKKVTLPFTVNYLAQAAGVAALAPAARDELARRCFEVVTERERVTAALREADFEVPTSQGNFVWLPLRERSADFAAHCEAHKVIVRPFSDASGGVRVTIGTGDENDAFLAAARTF